MKIIKRLIVMLLPFLTGCILSVALVTKILWPKVVLYKMLAKKHLQIIDVFKAWMIMLEMGKKIDVFFLQNGYKTVAICGMGYLGERLLAALERTDIEVKYVMEQKKNVSYGDTPVRSLDDDLEPVDVIVITPISHYYSIREQLSKKVDCKFVSIEEVFRNACDGERDLA